MCEPVVDDVSLHTYQEICMEEDPFTLECESSPLFTIGDKFQSLEQLEQKIKLFEESNYVQLWKREARTIEGAQKRIARYLKPELRYYQLKYCCVHGGKGFKSVGKGDRSSS